MFYRVLKDGFKNPTNGKTHKKGQIVDIFHTIGEPLTQGKDPALARSVKVDEDTAMAMRLETEKNLK